MSVLRELKRRVTASKAAFVEPCLPTLADRPPAGDQWLHEIKHDGYRLQARRNADGVHLITRNGFNWTARYPTIAAGVAALRCCSCLIDGEVVVVDESGLASFDKLRYGPRENSDALFYAFDLIELDGKDLCNEPLETRKGKLSRIIKRLKSASIHFVDHLQLDDADLIFEHACALGCEGIVSKRLGSKYRSGRSTDWVKVKNPSAPAARRLEEEDWNDRRSKTR